MAEGGRGEEKRVRCRKCRHTLLEEPPHRMMARREEDEHIIPLYEDQLPDWMAEAVQEGGWTKGKLSCPSCSARVGGFDFVSGSSCSSPVYLVRSRVDLLDPSSAPPPLVLPKAREETGEEAPGNVESSENGSCVEEVVAFSKDGAEAEEEESSEHESNTESDHAEASRESSSTDEGLMMKSKKQKEKLRRKRRRRDASDRIGRREQQSVEEKRDARLKELLEAEPELNTLPEDVICPVCLDLLHEPFQVEPCGHIFCEPCLRRLGQKNPMNCSCPLCRTKIGFCKHLAATSREIREEHEQLYLKRKKFERSTPVFTYPLPWQPGWRNLLRGRPLGGNRFVIRDNRTEYLRAILHQIPFYIPPVMIANLINIGIFAFMMGFIEVFPNLLAVFFRSSNSSAGMNSTTAMALGGEGETSGEEIQAQVGEGGGDTWREEVGDQVEALDSTFYYVLFTLSVLAAALGQFLVNHELQGPLRVNRVTDLLLVVVITVLPLALLPAIMPYRTGEGTWIGGVIERSVKMLFAHLNLQTTVLVNETLIT